MGCENLVILPFIHSMQRPQQQQYVMIYRTLMKMRWQPSLKIIPHYESDTLYIDALVNSINNKVNEINWKPDIIIASYHGIPKNILTKVTHTIVMSQNHEACFRKI